MCTGGFGFLPDVHAEIRGRAADGCGESQDGWRLKKAGWESARNVAAIADALKDSGDFDGALKLYRKVLTNDTARLGPDHPLVANAYVNIGGVYNAQGKHDEVLDCNQKALAIYLRVHGPEHPHVAATQDNIASVLKEQEKLPEVLSKMHSKALSTQS